VSVPRPAAGAAESQAAQPSGPRETAGEPVIVVSADGRAGEAAPHAYAGLVTRTIALALDAAIIEGTAALVAVTVGLGLSLLSISEQLETIVAAILGVAWVLWSLGYFVFFWSTTGETPGSRIMGIRVIDSKDRGPLKPRRAALRFGGLILAAIPLFAGFLMMLWDNRSRCFQDHLARTVVIYKESTQPPKSSVGRDLERRPRFSSPSA